MDNQLDPQAVSLAKAIGIAESGGNYNAKGKSGEFGAYQFMPETYKAYAGKYLGNPNAEPSIENQNKIAYSFIKEKKDQGYNPAQIASMWNAGEGRPNAYKEGHAGVNQMGVKYDTPSYVKSVSDNYRRLVGAQPQPTVPEKKQQMVEQGQPVSTREDRAEPTTAGNIIRGIVRPIATLAARPIQLAKALGGATEEEQTIKSKYLGDIKTSASGKDVVKDIGRGIEAVSYGMGGGAAAQAGKGLIKQGIRQTAKTAAKEGAKAGLVGGAGMAIAEGEKPLEVVEQAAVGGALGGITGGLLGGASATLGKAARATKRGLQATGLVPVGDKSLDQAITRVAQEYERAAGTGLPNKFRQKNISRTGEFKPWSQTLAEYGIVPKEGIDKSWDVEDALMQLDGINQQFGSAKKNFLQNERALFDIDEAVNLAKKKVDESTPSRIARQQQYDLIDREVEALLQGANVTTSAKGSRLLPIDLIEEVRDIGNSYRKFDPSDTLRVKSGAGTALSKSVNEIVDKYATFPSYRSFNREWSNILNAQEALEQLSTKKVRLSKGLSGQIALKTLAPLFGFSQGGIVGAILGDMGAETAGRVLSDPELRTIISRSIIRKAQQKLPKDRIIADLQKEIAEFTQKQAQLPRLPAPIKPEKKVVDGVTYVSSGPTIPLGAEAPAQSGVKLVPAKKNPTTVNPKTKKFQRSYSSEGLL